MLLFITLSGSFNAIHLAFAINCGYQNNQQIRQRASASHLLGFSSEDSCCKNEKNGCSVDVRNRSQSSCHWQWQRSGLVVNACSTLLILFSFRPIPLFSLALSPNLPVIFVSSFDRVPSGCMTSGSTPSDDGPLACQWSRTQSGHAGGQC